MCVCLCERVCVCLCVRDVSAMQDKSLVEMRGTPLCMCVCVCVCVWVGAREKASERKSAHVKGTCYGAATIRRLLKIIGLFCRI